MLPSTPFRTRLRLVYPLLLLTVTAAPARAADRAVTVVSGDWSLSTTWTGGVVPTASDNAFVGSSFPAGALATATVNLSQNVTAGNVYLGRSAGTSGTLQLGNFTLTANEFYFGFAGSGTITRGSGHIDVNRFEIRNGNSFTLAPTDVVRDALHAFGGSTVTLSANFTVADKIDLRDAGTALNAQGFNIRATNEILLGWNGAGPQLQNRGTITTNRMNVRGQNFDLRPTDAVSYFIMGQGTTNLGAGVAVNRLDLRENATGTTVDTGNITNYVDVLSGSTLTLGANLVLSDKLNIRDNGTVVNAANWDITATNEILLGWDGGTPALQNRGKLTTGKLSLRGQNFNLTPTDAVGYFVMSQGTTNLAAGVKVNRLDLRENTTGTTVETGNITNYVDVSSGSTLTLGANLVLSDKLNIRDNGTVVNAASKDILATSQILLGWDGGSPVLQNRGKLTTNELIVRGQDFQLTPVDAVSRLILHSGGTTLSAGVRLNRLDLLGTATGSTAETANISSYVQIEGGSALTLGANLTLSDKLNLVGGGTVVNAAGRNISAASQFLFGWDGAGTPVLNNVGTLTVGELYQRNGTQLTLTSGQDSTGRINLFGDSRLTAAVSAAGSGLTLTRTAAGELVIESGSHLTLSGNGSTAGWAFRWANPAGGDHVAALNTLISEGKIDFTFAGGGYTVTSSTDGYTYILVPVPEPGAILVLGAAAIGIGSIVRRRRGGAKSPSG